MAIQEISKEEAEVVSGAILSFEGDWCGTQRFLDLIKPGRGGRGGGILGSVAGIIASAGNLVVNVLTSVNNVVGLGL